MTITYVCYKKVIFTNKAKKILTDILLNNVINQNKALLAKKNYVR